MAGRRVVSRATRYALVVLLAGCVSGVVPSVPVPSFGEQVTCHVDRQCPNTAHDVHDESSCVDHVADAQDPIFAECEADACSCIVMCAKASWWPCLKPSEDQP